MAKKQSESAVAVETPAELPVETASVVDDVAPSLEGLDTAQPDKNETPDETPTETPVIPLVPVETEVVDVAALKAEKAKAELAQMAEESLARGAKKVTTP
jgi:hypothetical protein